MSTVTVLIATLAIFSPILSSPLEPRRWGQEMDSGVLDSDWTPGFIGDQPYTDPDSDYLRATHCYCKTAFGDSADLTKRIPRDLSGGDGGIQPNEIVQGHVWRYEYYNWHNNATYFLNHLCIEDAFPADKYGCGYDSPGNFQPTHGFRARLNPSDYTFEYSPIPNHEKHTFMIYKKFHDVDWIKYGRGKKTKLQGRRLDKAQGLIIMPSSYIESACTDLCEKELLLPVDTQVKSHGELYNNLDDMCDRCK